MPPLPPHIERTLARLNEAQHLRTLPPSSDLIDFTSNDYLGLARSSVTIAATGATGSRLLSGNHRIHAEVEQFGADFFRAEAALLFNSGYVANLGLLSAVAQRGDTIFYDAQVHASIRECLKLSDSHALKFRHNDLDHLSYLIEKSSGSVFVVTEGLFSMSGDLAPLRELVLFCRKNNAYLIVDEAHSTGIYGSEGAGLCVELGLENEVFARMHSFGKAPGWMGAMVVGGKPLKEFLVNRARTFIYTTAMPAAFARVIGERLDNVRRMEAERAQLWMARAWMAEELPGRVERVQSPIVPIVHPGNAEVRKLAEAVQNAGFDVRPILSPTVRTGEEQLRIVLHSFNTENEVRGLAEALRISG